MLISMWLAVFCTVIIPLAVSHYVYVYKPHLAIRPRIFQTILLVVLSSLALDIIAAIFFILNPYGAALIMQIKIYMFFVAVPFYYWATAFWSNPEYDRDRKKRFYSIQIAGLLIGFIVGFYVTDNHEWHNITTIPGTITSLSGWLFVILPQYMTK